jgi:beta-glucosidase-like glycosyl hydrolase
VTGSQPWRETARSPTVDGVPVAADPAVLDTLLREDLGFEGTVVADYFSVAFLQTLHGVAGSPEEAAAAALAAGIDVELPTVSCFGAPLLAAVRDGPVDERLVDRASSVDIRRTLRPQVTGERRHPGRDRHLEPDTVVEPSAATMVP